MKLISLFYFYLFLKLQAPTKISATESTTRGQSEVCPCEDDGDKTQCLLTQMFDSLRYWRTESSMCVSEDYRINVKPWLNPIQKTVTSYYVGYMETCFLQSGQSSNTPTLFVNNSSPCGLYNCCIECSTCFDNMYNILDYKGPVILRPEVTDRVNFENADRLSVLCYLSDINEALGSQNVYVSYIKDNNCANQQNVTLTHLSTSTISIHEEAQKSSSTDFLDDQVTVALVSLVVVMLFLTVICVGINNYILSRVYKITPVTAV